MQADSQRTKDKGQRTKYLLILPVLWFFLAWAAAEILIVRQPLPEADAIFVMSGSSAYVERTQKAAEIFHQGRAVKIFLTNDTGKAGWSKAEQRNPFFRELARNELIKRDVPENAIEILPEPVYGTRDEAVLIAKIAAERNLDSILIVTSGYHSRRTLWTLRRVFDEKKITAELGIESPPTGQQMPPEWRWWLSLTGWRNVAGEYLKFGYYWLFY